MSAEEVIYEVELRADPEIAPEFDAWLQAHIDEMLLLPGFVDAELLSRDDGSGESHTRVARYRLTSRADLDRYLADDAPRMRAEGLERFGDRFSATRRILTMAPHALVLSGASSLPEQGAAEQQQPELCKNCGYPLTAAYCSQCGQRAGTHVLSFSEWFADIAEALFTFDSRVFRSVLPLLFRPGFLTREFVRGRRASYIAPLRLYLFISIIFFLLAANLTHFNSGNGPVFDAPATSQTASDAKHASSQDDEIDVRVLDWLPMHDMVEAKIKAQARRAKADPQAFFRDLSASVFNNVPKMMFFFLPLVALMLKLLYIRSGRYYLEHLVFSLHFHAFFFLALITFIVAGQIGDNYAAASTPIAILKTVIWLYMPYYLFRAMRVNYEQGRFKTFIKYFLLGFGYLISLTITFSATAVLSVLTA